MLQGDDPTLGRRFVEFTVPRGLEPEGHVNLPHALTAWCIVLFRHFEQETFGVELGLAPELSTAERPTGFPSRVGSARAFALSVDMSVAELLTSVALVLTGEVSPSLVAEFGFGLGCALPSEPRPVGVPGQSPTFTAKLGLVQHGAKAETFRLFFDPSETSEVLARDLAERFCAVFPALQHLESARIDEVPLLSAARQEELRRAWTGASVAPGIVPQFREFERHARERPQATAVSVGGRSVSYAELNLRANRVAHWLAEQGIGRGARVALCMDPCVEFVVIFLGVIKAGATHVPVEPSYPEERQAVIIEDTEPRLIVAHDSYKTRFGTATCPVVSPVYVEEHASGCSADNPDVPVVGSDVVYIMYTSGTTGKPKGVMITHDNLAHFMRSVVQTYGFGPQDTVPAVARFSFSITYFEVLSPLVSGGRLLLMERGAVLELPRVIEMLREVTCIHVSPSLWRKVITYIDEQRLPLSQFAHLRHVSSGGDMVPPDILEGLKRLFVNAEVFVIYGCSEGACMSCSYEAPRSRALTSTRVGKAFPNAGIRLLDPAGNVVPPGVVGEVCFFGAGLAKGYLNLPELTAEKFINWRGERIYRTGDLGRIDDEGNLQLVGRSDFQIKLRGMRLEAADIESQLRMIAGVRDAVVTAPQMPDGERQLVAYVVSVPGTEPSARKWRDALKLRLPDYMVPAFYVALDALPVNANNKLDRKKLNTLAYETLSFGDVVPPKTPQETALIALWKQVLGVKELGIRDDFFEVGGTSLRAVEVMSLLEKQFGVALPVSVLLSDPTIEQLAQWIASPEAGQSPLTPNKLEICLKRGTGRRPAVFFVHDGDGESLPYRNLAMLLHPDHSVYGLQPKGNRVHPMLHTRIEDAVAHYASRILELQPAGPYFVGGLCVGGLLAYEVGKRLQSLGHDVGVIAVMDTAFIDAKPKSVTSRRAGRLRSAILEAKGNLLQRATLIAAEVARRGRNTLSYEARARFDRASKKARFRVLRLCLDNGLPVPGSLPPLSVDSILRVAEREYTDRTVFPGEILMFRATKRDPALDGIVDDTPYQDIFEDTDLAWSGRAKQVHFYDIAGGHSSMLREPAVLRLAELLQQHIDAALERANSVAAVSARAAE